MKKIRVQDAVGKELFHDLTAIQADGKKGVQFPRGHIIREEDIPTLLNMGKDNIFVAEEDENYVHEEDAAETVLDLCYDSSLEKRGPAEGKFTLHSRHNGLFIVNREGLLAINRTPDYTFASIKHASPVKSGDMVVGARIVPLTTKQETVNLARSKAQLFRPIFKVLPYINKPTGYIITGNEIYFGRKEDAFESILDNKLATYGADKLDCILCPDDIDAICNAVKVLKEKNCEVILMTGGMSVDPDDLTPTAIKKMSDCFLFQGLPIQPGNMLTAAYSGNSILIGVPGASMHAKVTALDILLSRVYSEYPISKDDFIEMGEGGLSVCKTWPL